MSNKVMNLYSSEGCHLCEQALELCEQLGIETQVEVIDIVERNEFFETYKLHIPVIEHKQSAKKLFWPFSKEELKELL